MADRAASQRDVSCVVAFDQNDDADYCRCRGNCAGGDQRGLAKVQDAVMRYRAARASASTAAAAARVALSLLSNKSLPMQLKEDVKLLLKRHIDSL